MCSFLQQVPNAYNLSELVVLDLQKVFEKVR